MTPPQSFDLIVLGGGPAGEKGAAQAAYFGKRVAVVEREAWFGGAGLNTGTVPSKTLRETALYFSGLRGRGLYGIDYSLREGLTVKDFTFRQRVVSDAERDHVVETFQRYDVQVVWGVASFVDAHTVRVQESTGGAVDLKGTIVLIATGSAPFHPPGVPFDRRIIYDSDTILEMECIPSTMLVVGGGVIGSEY